MAKGTSQSQTASSAGGTAGPVKAAPRGTAASVAGMRRRRLGGGGGGGSSASFGGGSALHVFGKLYRYRSGAA
ncbi:hypothetical protein KSP39_PZI013347 [Platanthera zijinensis]|uniref:Uncharacterized protein n=1 Tax=Platanthera zijinensis TaxID=2320716 RepID=A0AAP0G3I7_9ASPA